MLRRVSAIPTAFPPAMRKLFRSYNEHWEACVMEPHPSPQVILVNGLPATGKTTLARRIATDLRLPLLAKDAIKETLFDTLGWSDRA